MKLKNNFQPFVCAPSTLLQKIKFNLKCKESIVLLFGKTWISTNFKIDKIFELLWISSTEMFLLFYTIRFSSAIVCIVKWWRLGECFLLWRFFKYIDSYLFVSLIISKEMSLVFSFSFSPMLINFGIGSLENDWKCPSRVSFNFYWILLEHF